MKTITALQLTALMFFAARASAQNTSGQGQQTGAPVTPVNSMNNAAKLMDTGVTGPGSPAITIPGGAVINNNLIPQNNPQYAPAGNQIQGATPNTLTPAGLPMSAPQMNSRQTFNPITAPISPIIAAPQGGSKSPEVGDDVPATGNHSFFPQTDSSVQTIDKSINAAKKSEADAGQPQGDETPLSESLNEIFDFKASGQSLAKPNSPMIVAGKTQQIVGRIIQIASVAEKAAAEDAPKLYKAAIAESREAADKKLITHEAAGRVEEAVMAFARNRAGKALSEIATSAYKAAASGPSGARDVVRALDGLAGWQSLLNLPGLPLLSNAERLKSDIARVQEESARSTSPIEAPTVRIVNVKKGGAYFAELPGSSVAAIKKDLSAEFTLPADPSATFGFEEVLLTEHAGSYGLRDYYHLARAGGSGAMAAAFSAARLTLRSALSMFWHWLKALVSSVFGEHAADLSAFRHAPTAEESAFIASIPGVKTVFVNLSTINRPYLAVQRLLSASVVDREAVLEAAFALADAYQKITDDDSGRAGLEKLASRMSVGTPVSPTDARLLGLWVERLRDGALAAVTNQRGASGVFADLTEGYGMVGGVLTSQAAAKAAQGAGFDIVSRGPVFFATFGPGFSATALKQALGDILNAAGGRAQARDVSRSALLIKNAVAFARGHGKQAQEAARQIQMMMASVPSLKFIPKGEAGLGDQLLRVFVGGNKYVLLVQPYTGRMYGWPAAH